MDELHSSKVISRSNELPPQSPLYHSQHADRYERQALIKEYEKQFECKLVVIIDVIGPWGMTFLEDMIYDAESNQDMHVLLASPGGDGDTAVRMVRSLQKRCENLFILIPDQAKSAATLLALGSHGIVMGPTSDFGPIDPQLQVNPTSNQFISAKNILAAVENAARKVQEAPETLPLYASLLSNVNALMIQEAQSALNRTKDLLEEALASNPDRSTEDIANLKSVFVMS